MASGGFILPCTWFCDRVIFLKNILYLLKFYFVCGISRESLIKQSLGLVENFCPVKETNRTHSRGYVEDLSTQTGRKRCTKTAVLNVSVLPITIDL